MKKRDELTDPNSCLNKAKDDEMLFVLLGRDKAATVAVRAWIEERIRLGKNERTDAKIVEAEAWIDKVRAERHGLEQGYYRVVSGGFSGTIVRFHFINSLGNADCRIFRHANGKPDERREILVVPPSNLQRVVYEDWPGYAGCCKNCQMPKSYHRGDALGCDWNDPNI